MVIMGLGIAWTVFSVFNVKYLDGGIVCWPFEKVTAR